jgi:hypothetical protein
VLQQGVVTSTWQFANAGFRREVRKKGKWRDSDVQNIADVTWLYRQTI